MMTVGQANERYERTGRAFVFRHGIHCGFLSKGCVR